MQKFKLSIAQELQAVQETYMQSCGKKIDIIQKVIKCPVFFFGLFSGISIIAYSFFFMPYCKSSLFVGVLILIFVGLNFFLNVWITAKKKRDVCKRINSLVELLQDLNEQSTSKELIQEFQNYIDKLVIGTSGLPSHDFISVYINEDSVIPFPTALLSTGHTIGLGSGQASPCHAICFYDKCLTLQRGDIFYSEKLVNHHCCDENNLNKFCVLKSPFVEEIEFCLHFSTQDSTINLKQPMSVMTKNQERMMRLVMHALIPFACVASLFVVFAWYILWPCFASKKKVISLFMEIDHFWIETFVITPVLTIFPILPIIAPSVQIFLYVINEAKTLSSCFKPPSKNLLHSNPKVIWHKIFFDMIREKRTLFGLNGAAFDSLGSLTALCCINKEGILSKFNSTPEKICFIKDVQGSDPDQDHEEMPEQLLLEVSPERMANNQSLVKLEVLTVSQDSKKLQFDDPDWSNHITSLKPIALTIVTNSKCGIGDSLTASDDCQHSFIHRFLEDFKKTQANKSFLKEQEKFLYHCQQLHFAALKLDCTMPDASGLMLGMHSFPQLIGCDPSVSLLHNHKRHLTAYKKIEGSGDSKKSVSSSLGGSEFQPASSYLGYIHGVVISQWPNNEQDYILTSGCGSLVIDLCSHYWNGTDVKVLDDATKRKLLDFYHRSTITGACIMFAFKPVPSGFSTGVSCFGMFEIESCNQTPSTNTCTFPSQQIFVGALSMQHQPRAGVFRLVEALVGASIRFVHFSSEDEFKARVFAEKMGLEVGWNCHISLASKAAPQHANKDDSKHGKYSNNDDQEDNPGMVLLERSPQTPQSESSFSDSAFYQQNRAKLPRGIENILPHIEQVDNVPLLVPLFTDCQHHSTLKMLSVMQHYDEVVCCVGSSACLDNFRCFAQADVSIAVHPMFSSQTSSNSSDSFKFQRFPKLNFSTYIDSVEVKTSDKVGDCRLMALACILNTFPCCVTTKGDDSFVLIYNMIVQARHCLFVTTTSVTLLLNLLFMITTIQLLTSALHLPLIFSPLDVLWLSYVIIPLISFSLLASPHDRDLMTWAPLKNTSKQNKLREILKDSAKQFATKCLPSCVVVVLLFALCILATCNYVHHQQLKLEDNQSSMFNISTNNLSCYPCFTLNYNSTLDQSMLQRFSSNQKLISQQICVAACVLYIGCISSGYVHRWRSFFHCLPFSNRVWSVCVLCSWVLQAVYSTVIIMVKQHPDVLPGSLFALPSTQVVLWIVFFVWVFPLLLINEGAKHYEIKLWTRNQKRARLAFGTKLGMNSPF